MKKQIELKHKILNHLMKNGEKNVAEKILLKSVKEMQKKLKNQAESVIKLSVVFLTPIFKLHVLKNKKRKKTKIKEIPSFIINKIRRNSLAIKFILKSIQTKKTSFYLKLKQELLFTAKQESFSLKTKNELQKKVIQNKRYFFFYRWK